MSFNNENIREKENRKQIERDICFNTKEKIVKTTATATVNAKCCDRISNFYE